MVQLTHHKKSVRALAIHPTEFSFASGSAGGNNIKKWKCPEGTFVHNFSGHDAIVNTLSVNSEGVFFSGGELSVIYYSYSFLQSHLRLMPLSSSSPFLLKPITVPSLGGTTKRDCRSSIWMMSHNRVRLTPRLGCSARHSIRLGRD